MESLLEAAIHPRLSLHDPRAGLRLSAEEIAAGVDLLCERFAGLEPGTRVLLQSESDWLDALMVLACLRLLVTLVPLDPELGREVREDIEREVDPAVRLVGPERDELAAICKAAISGPRAAPADKLDTDAERLAESVALLLYSSGTTSKPKGIQFDRRQMSFLVDALSASLAYPHGSTIYSRLPLTFDYGLFQIFLADRFASELVLARGLTAAQSAVNLTADGGRIVLPLVPRMGGAVLAALARARRTAPRVALITTTGEFVDDEFYDRLQAAFPSAAIQLMYGLTECKRVSVSPPIRGPRPSNSYAGLPLPGTAVRVTDDAGRSVPPMVTGEIRVSGPHLSRGYWHAQAATDQRFVVSPEDGRREMRSGDLGRIREDGGVEVLGRMDRVIKHRGYRVSLLEVDAVATVQPGVDSAITLEEGGSLYTVYVGTVESGALEHAIFESLGSRYFPLRAVQVDRMPSGVRGKVDYESLRLTIMKESPDA